MGNKLPEPAQLDTENKVMDLRRQGFSWRNIAEQTGFANHSGAMKAYRRAMERYQKEPREDLQRIEGERLDDIFNAFFAKAIADLGRTDILSQKYKREVEAQIRQQARIEAASELTEQLKNDGLSEQLEASIKRILVGK